MGGKWGTWVPPTLSGYPIPLALFVICEVLKALEFAHKRVDEEGEMSTNDVNARFVNGKPCSIESTIVMKSPEEWDRFMRFMEKYGEANGLGFTKA